MNPAFPHSSARAVAISIATLPERAQAPTIANLAAVLGGHGWMRRAWRNGPGARAALRRVTRRIAAEVRRIRGRFAWQRSALCRQSVFRAFWLAFRF